MGGAVCALQGNIYDFVNKTGLYPKGVLYFGDHIDSDLQVLITIAIAITISIVILWQDPMLKLGWRTGCIVPELGGEISLQNGDAYRKCVTWLHTLTHLIGRFLPCPWLTSSDLV